MRKPERGWKCGGARHLELLLPPEEESQRPDHPEAESRSSPRRSVVVVVIETPKYERPCNKMTLGHPWRIQARASNKGAGLPSATAPRLTRSESQLYHD